MPEQTTADDVADRRGVRVSDSLQTIFSSLPRTKRKDGVDRSRPDDGESSGYGNGDSSLVGNILKPRRHVSSFLIHSIFVCILLL